MMKALALAVIVMCLLHRVASAEDFSSGKFYLPHCERVLNAPTEAPMAGGACVEAVQMLMYVGDQILPQVSVCTPREATVSEGLRILVQFMKGHPELLHKSLEFLTVVALHNAWPCKRDKQ